MMKEKFISKYWTTAGSCWWFMDWCIGDIHGCYHTLLALLEKVKVCDEEPRFIFVGDYIDRGLFSREVLDVVVKMQADGAICLRGNHDDVVDYLLNNRSESDPREWVRGAPTPSNVLRFWRMNGLTPTLTSYGVSQINDDIAVNEFQSAVPQNHKDFLRTLPVYWENESHFVCHGFMRYTEPLPRDSRFIKKDICNEILWSRFPPDPIGGISLVARCAWDKIGVFGHTPTQIYGSPVPVKWNNIRLIDTRVFFADGYLTAYCCQQDNHILQATDSTDVSTNS